MLNTVKSSARKLPAVIRTEEENERLIAELQDLDSRYEPTDAREAALASSPCDTFLIDMNQASVCFAPRSGFMAVRLCLDAPLAEFRV
jgi:hypothetical protein